MNKNQNIIGQFKAKKNDTPVKVYLHLALDDAFFSASSHGCRHGSVTAYEVTRNYAAHLDKINVVTHPTIRVSLLCTDDDHKSRVYEMGWDNNLVLMVRGSEIPDPVGS